MSSIKKQPTYKQAWEQLKKHQVLTLVAPVQFHARIRKAITKQKYQDTAFKLSNDHDYFWIDVVIEKDAKGKATGKLTFHLRQRLGFVGVKNKPSEDIGL